MKYCPCTDSDCPQIHKWDVTGGGVGKGEIPARLAKAEAAAKKAHEDLIASLMSESQVNLIRSLFKEVRQDLIEQDQERLIQIMKSHIAGDELQTKKWANDMILRLRNRKFHKWERRQFATHEEAVKHCAKMKRGAIKPINPPTKFHWVWYARREESIFS